MADEPKNITTDEHFEIFKTECRKWVNILGLMGWEIFYSHKPVKESSRANASYHVMGRIATLNLEPVWKDSDVSSDDEIRRIAFHEVCEVLMARIAIIGKDRYISESEIDEEVHNVIRTLENVLWEPRDADAV